MANMSYCRFENTYRALEDCAIALEEKGIEEYIKEANEYEKPFISRLIRLCEEISGDFKEDLTENNK